MKEILAQKINGVWHPYTLLDADISSEFKENQVCRLEIHGTQKERSVPQLQMFWSLCQVVANNTDDKHWNTRLKVADQIKIELQFVDLDRTIVDSKGNVHVHYRSISFKELRHMEACNFFDRAWKVMAKKLKITVDELLAEK